MSLTTLSLFTALLMAPAVPQEASALDSPEGKRMEAALKATGFSYGRSQDQKAFIVLFSRDGEPNRTINIAPTPSAVGPMQGHLIYSTIWRGTNPGQELLSTVMGAIQKYGSPYILKAQDQTYIRFGETFDINLVAAEPTADDPGVKQLKDMLYFVDAASHAILLEVRKLPAEQRGEGSG